MGDSYPGGGYHEVNSIVKTEESSVELIGDVVEKYHLSYSPASFTFPVHTELKQLSNQKK
jgi:hypothetical protein